MKYGGKLLNIFLFVITVGYVLIGLTYSRTPRIFPLIIGIPMVLLTGFQALLDFFPNLSRKYSELGGLDAENISNQGQKANKNKEPYDAEKSRKELEIFLWLGVAVTLIMLVGIMAGLPFFIFIFLKFRYAQGWKLSLSLPLGTMLVMYIIFIKVLTLPLYKGFFLSG